MGGALVECYSGSEYAERPTAVHWNGQRLEIEEVEQQVRTPQGKVFWVRCLGGDRFKVEYDLREDRWIIEMQ